jgi:hypothetical protein
MAALFLHFSLRLYAESQDGFLANAFLPESSPQIADDSALFDLLEKRIGSVVFAYTALESFANHSIPDDFAWEQERQDKKCTETYRKDQIERALSLKVKFDQVLPAIFGVASPSGTIVWSDFVDLEKLRDRLIHLKTADIEGMKGDGQPNTDAIWHVLIRPTIPNPVLQALNLIGHYVEARGRLPRWYAKFPDA